MQDLFKDLVWDTLVKAALQRLFLLVPFLSWGPLGTIITWLALKYADELYAAVALYIDVETIAFRNQEFGQTFASAEINLKQVAGKSGIDSQEFQNARTTEKQALSNVIKFDPSRLSRGVRRMFVDHDSRWAGVYSRRGYRGRG